MVTKTLVLAAALASAAAFTAPAFAQDASRTHEDAAVRRTEVTFTDADQIRGSRNSPWGDRLHARARSRRESLIRPRTGFLPELLSTVEKL